MAIEYYPLSSVSVGTIFKNGSFSNRNCIAHPITTFIKEDSQQTSTSGTSKYVQTEHMNKGSLGISASYGVSGVSKYSLAVSGYYGSAASKSGKSVQINQNIIAISGKELLNVEELKVSDLINAMSTNVKDDLQNVLDKFVALQTALGATQSFDVKDVVEKASETYEAWTSALERFFQDHGDGFVVGVHWGAFGTVKLDITSTQVGNHANYGAELEGTYSGIGAGVTVKGAYAGSQSMDDASIKASVISSNNGSYVLPVLDRWRTKVEEAAVKDLANFEFTKMTSDIAPITDRTPKIPEFQKKEADKGIVDKLGAIKDIKGLEAFAKAQAYDEAAKKHAENNNGEKLLLSSFLENANQPADNSILDAIIENADDIEMQPIAQREKRQNIQSNKNATDDINKDIDTSTKRVLKPDGYVAIGATVCNWSDLFPWLVRGIDNRLANANGPMLILQWRTMIQDAQALSNMYHLAAKVLIRLPNNNDFFPFAESFDVMQNILQNINLESPNYSDVMQKALDHLSTEERKIYKVWCDTKILRSAELGLGYVSYFDGKQTSIVSSEHYPNPLYDYAYDIRHSPNKFESVNYNAFSYFVKLYPIIFPDGRIAAFSSKGYYGTHYCDDPSRGIITADGFSKSNGMRIKKTIEGKSPHDISYSFWIMDLQLNKEQKCFEVPNVVRKGWDDKEAKRGHVKMFPIPLSATEGLEPDENGLGGWIRGIASGTVSLNSFKELKKNLSNLQNELAGKNNYSYSSENHNEQQWKPDLALSGLHIPEYYIGIQPNLKNALKVFRP